MPRFALINDLATGTRTYAPVTYLFSDDPSPSMYDNESKLRTLVLDLSEDGERVEHVQSLSSEWQILNAKMRTSARMASVDGGESTAGNTLLNIDGLGLFTPLVRVDDVFDLARQFSERYHLECFLLILGTK